ncbi:MAG: hypothetical protein NXI23_26605 [Bacteroidetes bacterium]|jgi:hypothetical protein|nr:hypothetical protein [Bacteroidota bacterium]MDF1864169.1 hypothetical protein [Saprospiraceae bacterium]
MKIISNRLTLIRNSTLLLLSLTLFSCDPVQTIQVRNETDADATVTVVFNKGEYEYKFNELIESDTLIIELEPKDQNSVETFQFGLGTWEIQSSIDSLIAAVNLIEIKISKSTVRYRGEQQIRTFIEDRITGSRKELIEIILE